MHRFLHALRHGSDRCGNAVLRSLPDFLAEPTVLPKQLKSAFADPTLVGGGVRALDRKLHKRLKYCSNLRKKNGRFVCGRLLAEGDHKLTHCTNCGCTVSSLVDHVIELKELYPLLMRRSDLLQSIADYYPTSIKRLSQPPGDPNARVWCTESGLIARTDCTETPVNFTLDIIPKLDEVALSEKDGKLIHCKVIEGVNAERDKGFYRIRLENGEEHLVVNEDCSRVQKIGGLVPVNVSTMSDGAEVFKSSSMNYSNNSCVETIQNIGEAHRRRPEFSCFMGTTSGGCDHPNIDERTVWYEKQRRQLVKHGTVCTGAVSCKYAGRTVTAHDVKIVRNEFHKTLDHPELIK